MVDFEIVDREEARGIIAGADYGSRVRVVARSPNYVLFNALGCNYWNRDDRGNNGLKRLFQGRATIAQYEARSEKLDELFGEGATAGVVQAWRQHKTVLFDGGGTPLALPNHVQHRITREKYLDATADFRVDLTGRLPTCLQCGKNLEPRTNHHRMGYAIQDDHPKTLEDCQRRTNQQVIACHGYGMNRPDRWGHVEWFETWDGESMLDLHFCHGKDCAAKYGRRAAEAGVNLGSGVEPTPIPHIIREDVEHFEQPPPRHFTLADGSKLRL